MKFKQSKKLVLTMSIISLMAIITLIPNLAFATNTHSLDLERGSSQYTSISSDLGITGGNISYEFWVNLESSPAGIGNMGLFHQEDAGTKVAYNVYLDDLTTEYRLTWGRSRNGLGSDTIMYTVNMGTGSWHHIAYTYDGTNQRAFVDGALVAGPSAASGDGSAASTDQVIIGSGAGGYFDGKIDDVRVWNIALDSSTVADHYNSATELTGSESGLVANYKFNENYEDTTTNNYDLTAYGSPVFSTDIPFSSSAPIGVRKPSTETLSSDTTTDDDSDLAITLLPNKEYVMDGVVFASSTSSQPDIKVAFSAPTGTILDIGIIASTMREAELIQSPDTDTDGIPLSANKPAAIQITGTVKTGNTGGTLTLQWAQNSSNANAVAVLRGSYIRADEI